MNVLDLCDPEAAAVPVEASVAEAIKKMLDFHVGAVAIIDRERRVAGIFTERDVLRKFSLSGRDPAQTPVRELMTTPVELATSQTRPGKLWSPWLNAISGTFPWWITTASFSVCSPFATSWSGGSRI